MCGENFGRILFEIFCGYKKPKTGEIFVCNKDWLDLDENSRSLLNRRLFGIAAEEFPLIEFMTVEENISMPSLLDGDKSNIEELVKAFDIGHLLQKYPSDLNHREKMRCICARAFSGGRKVVVIFDLFKRMQEQRIKNDIQKKSGTTDIERDFTSSCGIVDTCKGGGKENKRHSGRDNP